MSEEIPDNKYRLEIEYRNPLQVFILKEMLGKKMHDHKAQEEWGAEYGKKISDILDTPEHEEIRTLAREKKYKEAAETIMEILEEEDEKDVIECSHLGFE